MSRTFASLVRQRAPYAGAGTLVGVVLAVAVVIPYPALTFFTGMLLGSLGCFAGLEYGYRYGDLPRWP